MKPATPGQIILVDDCEVDLKNRGFAAFLALLLPGAGHYYQGRRNKAVLYAVCIFSLFILGMFIGEGRVIYASWSAEDLRIQYPAQALIGLPAAPALVQALIASRDPERKFLNGFMAAPPMKAEIRFNNGRQLLSNRMTLHEWHERLSAGFELGTLYTAVAGLLNLLVVFDAYAGPMPLPQSDERRKKKRSAETPNSSS